MDILCIAVGFEAHERAHWFAADPGVDIIDLADVWHIALLVRGCCLCEHAVRICPVSADIFVECQLSVAIDAVKLAGDFVNARRECVASERDTAPGFSSAATAVLVIDRRFSDRDGSPVRRRHVCVEPQTHELLCLGTVAVAASNAVDDRAGFGAREAVFRTERAVFITADPA